MGKSCYLCKMMFIKGDTRRSFHKFPDAQYQREAWCQSLKVDIKKVKGWTFICSDHFVPESFNYRLNGTRFLKDDAVPLFYKGPIRPRKPKRTKSELNINPDIVKAECESQENENKALDENIKLEPSCAIDEDKNISIKTEKSVEELRVNDITKTESIYVKSEITEEVDIKDEESFTLLPCEVKGEFKGLASNDISECEDKTEEGFYVETGPEKSSDTDLVARFNETYSGRSEVYACVECPFKTPAKNAIKKHFMVHRDAEFKSMAPTSTIAQFQKNQTEKEPSKIVEKIKKKVKRKANRTYSEDCLRKALFEIRENKMAIRLACRTFNVPKTTVLVRLSGRFPDNIRRKPGRPPLLSAEGENLLKEWLINTAKCGFPVKKETLLNAVSKIEADSGKEIFNNGIPHQAWYNNFVKRNPEMITLGKAQEGGTVIGEEEIRKWFGELTQFLTDKSLLDVLDDPSRVFNGDELGFALWSDSGNVLEPKGFMRPKGLFSIKVGNDKENKTVLILFNAAGKIAPPLVSVPYVDPPIAIVRCVPSNWVLGKSTKGCITSEIFFKYITNEFYKWVMEENITKPIIVFVDGLRLHMTMTYAFTEWCEENQIVFYALPPNTAHVLQPAEPMKTEWKKIYDRWQSEPENLNCASTNVNFCSVFHWVLPDTELEALIKDGFRKCGLFPLNPNANSKCVGNTAKKLIEQTSDEIITKLDITTAKKVVEKIRFKLESQGMNVDVILSEVKLLEQALFPEEGGITSTRV